MDRLEKIQEVIDWNKVELPLLPPIGEVDVEICERILLEQEKTSIFHPDLDTALRANGLDELANTWSKVEEAGFDADKSPLLKPYTDFLTPKILMDPFKRYKLWRDIKKDPVHNILLGMAINLPSESKIAYDGRILVLCIPIPEQRDQLKELCDPNKVNSVAYFITDTRRFDKEVGGFPILGIFQRNVDSGEVYDVRSSFPPTFEYFLFPQNMLSNINYFGKIKRYDDSYKGDSSTHETVLGRRRIIRFFNFRANPVTLARHEAIHIQHSDKNLYDKEYRLNYVRTRDLINKLFYRNKALKLMYPLFSGIDWGVSRLKGNIINEGLRMGLEEEVMTRLENHLFQIFMNNKGFSYETDFTLGESPINRSNVKLYEPRSIGIIDEVLSQLVKHYKLINKFFSAPKVQSAY